MDLKKYKEFYEKNGYLAAENIIDSQKCDYFLNLYKSHAEKKNNTIFSEMIQIHTEIPETLELMKDKKVVEIVQYILGSEAIGLQSICSFKKPGSPSGKYAWNAHQDNSYIKTDVDSYVSGDIVLDNHEEESGVLYVYPGSHKEKLLPFEPHKSFNLPDGENPGNRVIDMPTEYEKVDLYLRKGTLLMFHPLVIHGSYSNKSIDKWRPILLMNYVKKGSNFFKGSSVKRVPIELT